MSTFIQNPIQTYSEAQMLAFTPPVSPNLFFFYDSDQLGNLYSMNSAQQFVFVSSVDNNADYCTCTLSNTWMCGIMEAMGNGLVTPTQAQSAIASGLNISSVNSGNGNCSISITVPRTPPTLIAMSSSSMALGIHGFGRLYVSATPASADASVTWVSSDNTKVTVDQSGLVYGVAIGTATITAYSIYNSAVTATCLVTVAV